MNVDSEITKVFTGGEFMKLFFKILVTIGTAFSFSAFADGSARDPSLSKKDVLSCVVPNGADPSQVSLLISVHYDTSADFVIASVTEKGLIYRMFTQMGKGEVDDNLSKGELVLMLLEESYSQDAGVVRNAGLAIIDASQDGTYSGLLVAHRNVYPLTCTKN